MAKEGEKTPFWLYVIEDPMLLLFMGVTIYAVFYLLWGVMELSNLPPIPEDLKKSILGR
ncbi:MAG: hypothetical protein HY756_08300 [Nitrospirae bacterium]|nr:hypothetical protein [Nitrospirota bacterium]